MINHTYLLDVIGSKLQGLIILFYRLDAQLFYMNDPSISSVGLDNGPSFTNKPLTVYYIINLIILLRFIYLLLIKLHCRCMLKHLSVYRNIHTCIMYM